METVRIETPNKSYNIHLKPDFLTLADEIRHLNKSYSKIALIGDNLVMGLYQNTVQSVLSALGLEVHCHTFPHGESNKNYSTLNDFYSFLIGHQFDRKSLLIALGGGVTGDMVGFCAATYMRGVDFVQVPTSLLAQVDSSSGGKTGIDFNGYKNIVGAFYQPEMVYINTATLKTLPPNEFASGMGEALKHGLIMDADYFEFMASEDFDIKSLNHEAISRLIGRSCEIKARVVSQDEKEHGLRAILNFGHTIGHAIERLMDFKYLHGECVALGMAASTYISLQLGQLSESDRNKVLSTLKAYNLPVAFDSRRSNDVSASRIYDELFYDKKTDHARINIVLLNAIGSCYQNKSLDKTTIMKGIEVLFEA